jgi:nicotinamidase/pyrazinamidase
MKALVVVDMQNDFVSGTLPISNASKILPRVCEEISDYREHNLPIFITMDWHKKDHPSFIDQGGPWPPHCVQGTEGAQLAFIVNHVTPPSAYFIKKGQEVECYSGATPEMLATMKELNVDEAAVCGLALDYCVKATAMELRKHIPHVKVLLGATKPKDARAGWATLKELLDAGVAIET